MLKYQRSCEAGDEKQSGCSRLGRRPLLQGWPAFGYPPRASRRVASCSSSTSTDPGGSRMNRTKEPRTKQARTCVQGKAVRGRDEVEESCNIRPRRGIKREVSCDKQGSAAGANRW